MHYTPTYASWINQVERWFGLITQQAIRRGSFSSVKELTRKINTFVEHYNAQSSPFAWSPPPIPYSKNQSTLLSYLRDTTLVARTMRFRTSQLPHERRKPIH